MSGFLSDYFHEEETPVKQKEELVCHYDAKESETDEATKLKQQIKLMIEQRNNEKEKYETKIKCNEYFICLFLSAFLIFFMYLFVNLLALEDEIKNLENECQEKRILMLSKFVIIFVNLSLFLRNKTKNNKKSA